MSKFICPICKTEQPNFHRCSLPRPPVKQKTNEQIAQTEAEIIVCLLPHDRRHDCLPEIKKSILAAIKGAQQQHSDDLRTVLQGVLNDLESGFIAQHSAAADRKRDKHEKAIRDALWSATPEEKP